MVLLGSGYDPRKRFKVHRNGSQALTVLGFGFAAVTWVADHTGSEQ